MWLESEGILKQFFQTDLGKKRKILYPKSSAEVCLNVRYVCKVTFAVDFYVSELESFWISFLYKSLKVTCKSLA